MIKSNSEPLVSVIIATYNSEKYLEECILSILNQKYNEIELIIIDGKSKDKTLDIIKKYKEKRRRGIKISGRTIRRDTYQLYKNRLSLGLTLNDLDDLRKLLETFKQ